MDSLEQEIAAIVAEIAEIEPDQIVHDGTLRESGVDSLMSVEIAVCIEQRYGVHFDDNDLNRVRTFNDLVDHTRARLMSHQVA